MPQDPKIGREILPIPDIPNKGKPALDVREASFDPIKPLRPPKNSPNVVIVLIDDMGFGAPSAVGGPCQMPTMEKLAGEGLVYNRFHTTALCSPTRQALLTGRNHHSVGMGGITEMATSAPGYNSIRPNSAATIAEILRLNGYNTGAFGKMHQTPPWEVSVSGPFDRWPTGEGFEKFYGFVGGETNQWNPAIFDGTTPVEPWGGPKEGYHFSEDMIDKAIEWVEAQQTMTPDKPFFTYISFGATHAPHHVGPEWIKKYKGKFDKGWDKQREETLANMKKKGVVPKETVLAPKPPGVEEWKELSAVEQKIYARLMEVYAGFAEHTDAQVGRFVDSLEEMGTMKDTIFIYVAGDNGASAEGGLSGTVNEIMALNGIPEDLESVEKNIDKIGGPEAFNHYPVGWAHAMNTPYQWTKQVASHFGGTRNSTVVHWPKGIKAKGEIRQQFHHVIDLLPTILEAADIPEPYAVNGIAQKPIEGTSMNYSFDKQEAPDTRTTQYFEMFGNRGIYHDGWTAVTNHSTPWELAEKDLPKFADDQWELYNTNEDWSQANDLSKEMPEKLHELQELFLIEAAKYNVFPLDDRRSERFDARIAGRPDLPEGRKSAILYPKMNRLMENTIINVKNVSHTVSAEIEVTSKNANGVIVSQGGRFAGWSLYAKDHKLKYCYNWFNTEYSYVISSVKLPKGKIIVGFQYEFTGSKPGDGAKISLFINKMKVGKTKIEKSVPFLFSGDETMDVGVDLATPVTDDYPEGLENKFSEKINWVKIDLGDDDVNDQVDAELKYKKAMAKQ